MGGNKSGMKYIIDIVSMLEGCLDSVEKDIQIIEDLQKGLINLTKIYYFLNKLNFSFS